MISHQIQQEISREVPFDPALCLAHSQLHAQYIKQDNEGGGRLGSRSPGL